MSLDLILLTLPYLSSADANSLFAFCLTTEILEAKDNAVQKRGYKILGKLIESGKIQIDAEAVLQQLDKLLDGLSSAAKKVCCNVSLEVVRVLTCFKGPIYSAHSPAVTNSVHKSSYDPIYHPRSGAGYKRAFREGKDSGVRPYCCHGQENVRRRRR